MSAEPAVHPAASAALPRYATLDHWRGFAALSVVLFHAFNPWETQPAPPALAWLAALAGQGYRGVHIFFVISGYCIAQLGCHELRARRAFGGFLRQRCLRIFPPYWAACLVAAAVALVALPFNHAALFSSAQHRGVFPASVGALFAHAALLDPYLGRDGYLPVAWTLTWEVSFYLFAGLLLLLGLRFGVRVTLTLAFLAALAGTSPFVTHIFPPVAGWAEFMCGACVLLALLAIREGRPAWPWLAVITALGLAGWAQAAAASDLPVSAAFALALFGLHRFDLRLASTRSLSWLASLGVVSYSIYLIHPPVITAVRNGLGRFVSVDRVIFLLPVIAAVLASLVAARLFFRYVEAPLERWRKTLARSRAGTVSSP